MPTSNKRADYALEAAELTAQMESIKTEIAEFRQAQLLGDADLKSTRADLAARVKALDGKIGSLLEQRNSRRENSYGSIFATWLAVVATVVVGMLTPSNKRIF